MSKRQKSYLWKEKRCKTGLWPLSISEHKQLKLKNNFLYWDNLHISKLQFVWPMDSWHSLCERDQTMLNLKWLSVMTRAWSQATRDTQRKCDISLEFMRLTHWAVTRVCWVNVQIGIYIRLLCYSPGHVTPTHYDKLKWLHKLYIASNTLFIAILSNNTFVVTLSSLEYKTRIRIWLMLCTWAASGARSSAW